MTKHLMWSTALLLVVCGSASAAGPAPVKLGTAGSFVILAKTGITDVYKSAVTGDVGTSPITGAALLLTCKEVSGTVYTVNAAGPLPCKVTNPSFLTAAVGDMGFAYTDAAGRPSPDFIELGAGEIGGLTLAPGLYKWGTGVLISKDVTLSGGPDDVWVFQVAGTLKGQRYACDFGWRRTGQEHLLAGRWCGDSRNHRAFRGRHTGKNYDRR